MRFALIGGDRRSCELARLLEEDGHHVRSFASEEKSPRCVGCLQGCIYGAEAVVLPVPTLRDGTINAPLSREQITVGELTAALWPGQHVFGADAQLKDSAEAAGAIYHSIPGLPGFQEHNSALTAEGALELMIHNSPRSIAGSAVLVTGSGALSAALVPRLRALGALVTVCARRGGDMDFRALAEHPGKYDFVVNTVPARVLPQSGLRPAGPDALYLELASPPGGIAPGEAEKLGLRPLSAPGLPGKTAPLSAAMFLREAIYNVLEVGYGQ